MANSPCRQPLLKQWRVGMHTHYLNIPTWGKPGSVQVHALSVASSGIFPADCWQHWDTPELVGQSYLANSEALASVLLPVGISKWWGTPSEEREGLMPRLGKLPSLPGRIIQWGEWWIIVQAGKMPLSSWKALPVRRWRRRSQWGPCQVPKRLGEAHCPPPPPALQIYSGGEWWVVEMS